MSGNRNVTAVLFLLLIFPSYPASGQALSSSRQDGTAVSTSYRWIQLYESRYGQAPDQTRSLPDGGTTVVEYRTNTLEYVRTLYHSNDRLSSVNTGKSKSGRYYSITYSDWSKRLVRDDIPGEYDTIKDFGVVIGPDASVIRLFEDVVGLKWLEGDRLFIMQGVPTEACPDYHVDRMFIYSAEKQATLEEIDSALFCGRYPRFEDSRIIFPCCRAGVSREYIWDPGK